MSGFSGTCKSLYGSSGHDQCNSAGKVQQIFDLDGNISQVDDSENIISSSIDGSMMGERSGAGVYFEHLNNS